MSGGRGRAKGEMKECRRLLCPDLGLPTSCCGIPEAPGAPGSFFPSSPTSTGKPPDCCQIPPQIPPLAQMR
ncbi:SH2 domain-containing adapter protein E-like protein [Lates japonicus]|uniref:SH2 domain-containing adapter protein E-like protein n=1 Tax=Lates japonicus TaxID=270547 RepID=A0AAD3NB55_LATJO|nr:SH2 domain-containing adapter protein E-like protein [Lates japonicus]